MTPTQRAALESYVDEVRRHFGAQLVEVLVFGSRARGEARPDSDVDLAVVLLDGDWSFWKEKAHLADLAYDAMIESDLWIQAWPVPRSDWNEVDLRKAPFFVVSARIDARPVSEAK